MHVPSPTIGVDVGGTKVLVRALDPATPGVALAEHRTQTPVGMVDVVAAIAAGVAEVERQLAHSGDRGDGAPGDAAVGVGLPALVRPDGVLAFATHLSDAAGFDAASALGDALGRRVVVDNDANCAALAESTAGAGIGAGDMVLVTLGTGIGGGIIAGGHLLRGTHGFAGEIGHVEVVHDGRPCPCGRSGCWEQYASGNGLGITAREAAAEGRLPSVVARVGSVADVRGEDVVALASEGAPDALAVLDELGRWVAVGLADLVNVLDPAIVVLGGGVVDAGDLLLEPVRAHFGQMAIGAGHRTTPPIEVARLGSAAGAIGAALLAAGHG
jgi:glucokinase